MKAKKVNGDLSCFISFPYDNELVEIMRAQSSRFWHAQLKTWEVAAKNLPMIINKIGDREVTITGAYRPINNERPALPAGFNYKTQPFNHQIEGFEYGLRIDRFLLGDEQGLGKNKTSH